MSMYYGKFDIRAIVWLILCDSSIYSGGCWLFMSGGSGQLVISISKRVSELVHIVSYHMVLNKSATVT
jgi:hypothetical protein